MTPAERIAAAVEIVRKTRSVETAYQQTGVTSDVIRKACRAAGVLVTPRLTDSQKVTASPRAVMNYQRHQARPRCGDNEQVKQARREKELVALRGWDSHSFEDEEAAELVGINLHEPE